MIGIGGDTMAETDSIGVEQGVVYGTGGGGPLTGDVYVPREPGHSSMILVLCARGSTGPDSATIARLLAAKGHVAFTPEYRVGFRIGAKGFEPYSPEAWPAPVHDIKAAIRWSRANADRLGIDPECVVLFGRSNGGMLALAAAGAEDAGLEGDGGHREQSSRVAAVVAASAPTKLTQWGIPLIAGEGAPQDVVDQISPINHVRASFPPTMLLHGLADPMIPPSNSEALFAKLREAGATAEMHLYAGQDHGFATSPAFIVHTVDMIANFAMRYAPSKVAV
jgi:acetyl esterase/lipase